MLLSIDNITIGDLDVHAGDKWLLLFLSIYFDDSILIEIYFYLWIFLMLMIIVSLWWAIRYHYDYEDYVEAVNGGWNEE